MEVAVEAAEEVEVVVEAEEAEVVVEAEEVEVAVEVEEVEAAEEVEAVEVEQTPLLLRTSGSAETLQKSLREKEKKQTASSPNSNAII